MPRIVDDAPADEDYWTSPPEPRLHDQRGAAHHGRQHQRKPRLLGVSLPTWGAAPVDAPPPQQYYGGREAPAPAPALAPAPAATWDPRYDPAVLPGHPGPPTAQGFYRGQAGVADRRGEPAPEPAPYVFPADRLPPSAKGSPRRGRVSPP